MADKNLLNVIPLLFYVNLKCGCTWKYLDAYLSFIFYLKSYTVPIKQLWKALERENKWFYQRLNLKSTGASRGVFHPKRIFWKVFKFSSKVRATESTDMKLTFSERKFKDLSEMYTFIPLWCIVVELCHFILKGVATPQNRTNVNHRFSHSKLIS